jgi:valyl-tRNA synthetase
LVGSSPGNDMNLSLKKVQANRNFANKIWNAGRFVISAIGDQKSMADDSELRREYWTLADSWIWARLESLIRDVERLFQGYQYGEAGRQIYEFFWGDFADWYIEIAKLQLAQGGGRALVTAYTLARVLNQSLRLLHPFTPFVTEELWGHLRRALLASPLADLAKGWSEALIIASWPKPRPEEGWESARVADFSLVQEVVRLIRNLRSEKNVPPQRLIPATLVSASALPILQEQSASLAALAGLDPGALDILPSIEAKPEGSVALVAGPVEIYLPLAGLVDAGEERQRLGKELSEANTQIDRLGDLLKGPFAHKAPPTVVQKERDKLAAYQETAEKLKAQLAALDH